MSDPVPQDVEEGVEFALPFEPAIRVFTNKGGGVTIEVADNMDTECVAISRARLPWLIQRLTALNETLTEWYADEPSTDAAPPTDIGDHHA